MWLFGWLLVCWGVDEVEEGEGESETAKEQE